ncbi:glutamate racemase [Aliikangiella maris]|uniref:Glutamate racemase n=1 Tax=Aliikangiella maris TaxID=3162458 RepID=A0ABV3MMG0_9GAMM
MFDSGVGGLSIFNAVKDFLPQENIIYLADTRYAPYGDQSEAFIIERSQKITDFLLQHSIKLLVVACNTATAAAIQVLRDNYSIPIIGVEPAIKPAVEKTPEGRIGVIATKATLKSEKYQRLKARFAENASITEKATPLFVQLVETVAQLQPQHIAEIKQELQIFIDQKVNTLVLGCTHFPFLNEVIAQIMGAEVTILENAQPVAKEIARKLGDNVNLQNTARQLTFYSSNPAAAQAKFNLILRQKVNLLPF